MLSERLFALSDLTLPEDIYTRARGTPWWAHVHVYTEEMKAGAKFPPIIVGQLDDQLIVVDGYHRYQATKKLGIEHIQGILKKYKSMADLLVDAVAANNHHGIRYTPQDKSHIADLLQKHGLEPQKISELVRIPVEKLDKFTARNITGPMGQKTLKGPLMHLVSQGKITEAEAYEVFQGRFSTMTIDDVIVQLINYLEFGAYPWGDEKYFLYASRITGLIEPHLEAGKREFARKRDKVLVEEDPEEEEKKPEE